MPATLCVRLQPKAARNEILGWQEGALRVRLTAPPVEGAANRALVDFIAAALKVRRADVSLINGHHNRSKTLAIATLTPKELTERLGVERPV